LRGRFDERFNQGRYRLHPKARFGRNLQQLHAGSYALDVLQRNRAVELDGLG
jgi:hypothetical protein